MTKRQQSNEEEEAPLVCHNNHPLLHVDGRGLVLSSPEAQLAREYRDGSRRLKCERCKIHIYAGTFESRHAVFCGLESCRGPPSWNRYALCSRCVKIIGKNKETIARIGRGAPRVSKYARPTAETTVRSSLHGRMRREERSIQKIDLQSARRYGMEEPSRKKGKEHCTLHTYGGIVFVSDPKKKQEITAYKSNDFASDITGTKVAQPTVLGRYQFDDWTKEKRMQKIRKKFHGNAVAGKDIHEFTSHSVLVVDFSDFMRIDDINGAKCRSHCIMSVLARDFVEKPLKRKERSHLDLISVVAMINQDATVILDREPVTWLLYNRLVELGEWKHLRPNGRINFLPALTKAEEMLSSPVHDDLALSLFFFAVDKPSDKCPTERFDRKAASIASKFNGRISASFIGMTNSEEMDDTVLRSMAKTAQECGAEARFSMPPKDTRAFSGSTSSLASSLTMTKMNLSDKSHRRNRKTRTSQQNEKVRRIPLEIGRTTCG